MSYSDLNVKADNVFKECYDLGVEINTKKSLDSVREEKITNLGNKLLNLIDEAENALNHTKTTSPDFENYQKVISRCQEMMSSCERLVNVFHRSFNVHNTSHHKREVSISKIPIEFQTENKISFPDFKALAEKCIPEFIDKKLGKAYGYIFAGYGRRLVLKESQKEIHDLEKKQKDLSDKIKKNNEIIQTLKDQRAYVTSSFSIDALSMGMSTAVDLSIFDRIKELKLENTKLQNELTATQKWAKEKIPKLIQKINSIRAGTNKGRETRMVLEQIGGEPVNITTSDNVKLNGTFIHRNAFLNELKEQGGKHLTFTRTFSDGRVRQLRALAFPKSEVKKRDHIVNVLAKKMHAISDFNSQTKITGAGWSRIDDPQNDEVLLFADNDLMDWLNSETEAGAIIEAEKKNILHYIHFLIYQTDKFPAISPDAKGFSTTKKYSEIDFSEKSEAGTVILSSGNAGVYEMHKSEIMAFLFSGMSVMLFNFRGYGESEGKPSTEGLHNDMKAVYEFVKSYTGLEDKKLLFSALCMSGGAAAHVAALHPEVNILLNQTYSSFSELFKDQALDYIEDFIDQMGPDTDWKAQYLRKSVEMLPDLIHAAAAAVAPGFEVASNLEKNKGHKAIFYVHSDGLIQMSHVERNVRAVAEAGELGRLTVFSSPGEHSQNWVDVKTSPLGHEIDKLKAKKDQVLENLTKKSSKLQEKIKKNIPDQERKLLKKEKKRIDSIIATTESDFNEKVKELKATSELSADRVAMIARNGVENFLSKATLSDPIIPNSTQLKQKRNQVAK